MPMTEYTADAGTAVAEQAETTASTTIATAPIHDNEISEIVAVPLADIQASPFNPRQIHNAAADAELAESVRQVGVLEPVLLRPLPLQPGEDPFSHEHYELVFGHRRWLAAQAAGLDSIPAMIRTLSDADSAQLQAIENLQREDLTAMDEARGYAAFIETHGVNKDQLAARIGKSRTHVYNRLKLAALVPDAAKALLDGAASVAFASSLGLGVAFAALTVLIVQGTLTLLGSQLTFLLDARVLNELIGTGGVMILGIGLLLLDVRRLRVANFLPALVFAVLLALFFR